MKTTNPLTILLLVAGAAGLAGCASPGQLQGPEEPEVTLTRFAPRAAGLFEQGLDLSLRIRNPNEFPLEIVGLRYELDLSGRPIAHGAEDLRLTVPAYGTQDLLIAGRASTVDLAQGLARSGERESLSYELRGTLLLDQPEARTLAFEHESDRLDLD